MAAARTLAAVLLSTGTLCLPAAAHGAAYPASPSPAPSSPSGPSSAPSPTTPGTSLGGGFSHWEVWWTYNREPFLELKANLPVGALTGSDDFFLGQGEVEADAGLAPSAAQLADRVVPALLHALETERSDDVQSAALIALAKIGRGPVREALRPYLASSSQELAETAAIALGILGSEASAILLSDLLLDTPAGRNAVERESVRQRTRAYAAYGLGLIGRRSQRPEVRAFVISKLRAGLAVRAAALRDVEVACVLALGLVPTDSGGEQLSPSEADLLAFLLDKSRPRTARAHVPVSLARLAEQRAPAQRTAVARQLLDLLAADPRLPVEVQRGCVIALGKLVVPGAGKTSERALAWLERQAREHKNLTGDLALMALARIAGRPGADASGELETLGRVRSFLLGQLARGNSLRRPWAGLALALTERLRVERGLTTSDDVLAALRASLAARSSPDAGGGFCIALGLMGATVAASDLRERLQDWSVDSARGHAALGLGLMRARVARPELKALLLTSKYRPQLLRSCAMALALLGDTSAVPHLVSMLREARSLSSQAALAAALGTIGDRRALEALLPMLADEELSASARAFAAAALGIVGDKDLLPWNTVLSVGVNFAAPVPTLIDPAGGKGVLDLL